MIAAKEGKFTTRCSFSAYPVLIFFSMRKRKSATPATKRTNTKGTGGYKKHAKHYRNPERESRRPAHRLTELPDTRAEWDAKHPGPIYSEIVPTHICLEWPIELEYDPTHHLVKRFLESQSDSSARLMFYRIVNPKIVESRNVRFQRGESKTPFVWKPDVSNPVYSLLDETITLRELNPQEGEPQITRVQVTEWFRKDSHYKSGQCVVR